MPKLAKKVSEPDNNAPVSVSMLRALHALAESPQTLTRLDDMGAGLSGKDVQSMQGNAWIARTEIDLDGIKEILLVITEKGRQAMKGYAAPAIAKVRTDAITALVPWFGSARTQAKQVGEALRGCKWVGVPFAGSLCEIPAIIDAGACSVSINDKHALLINLARVAAGQSFGPKLYRWLRREPFTESTLRNAQQYLKHQGDLSDPENELVIGKHIDLAFHYFIAAWAGRNGKAGTDGELKGGLSVRWTASGGDSALRFSGAAWSIRDWRKILARCTLFCMDWADFAEKCKDEKGHGYYLDPPWPDAGDGYVHKFTNEEHALLAEWATSFETARVVLRTGEHPLIRKLYPTANGWEWRRMLGRNQAGKVAAEYLVVKNG